VALSVETGQGITGANSYVSLADALAYHADHGNAAWAASTDPLRTAALIRGTAALDSIYGDRWPGKRLLYTQSLDWPRAYAWDRDGYPLLLLPPQIVAATCEAALVELATPGALSLKFERGLKTLGVGAISKSWDGNSGAGIIAYPAIRQPLARIVRGGGNVSLVRT